MTHVRGLAAFVVAGLVVVAFVMLAASACFGGNGDGGPSGGRRALTDPASVPTATPIAGDVVFVIGPGGISAPDGDSTAGPATTPTGSGGSTYTVESGDTCADIAARFGITFADLRAANPIIDEGCRNLRPDQVLRIPPPTGGSTPATPVPGSSSGNTYVVESGDNCGSIAAAHGVSLAEFLAINDLTEDDCTSLQVGDVVRIP